MATEATEEEIEELSARIQRCPRDFLKRFGGNRCHDELAVVAAREEVEEIELSLGLSLGGCFRVEPKERRLLRSSSVATLSMFPLENDLSAVSPLQRTCSLPTETEEEHRKRKELQSLKRLEAKRKRSEKKNLLKLAAARDERDENFNERVNGGHGRVLPMVVQTEVSGCHDVPASNQVRGLMHGASSYGLPKSAAASGAGARPIDAGGASQGSIGLQGSSSSGVSDFKSQSVPVGTPTTTLSLPENTNHKAATSPATVAVGKPAISARKEEESSKKASARPNGAAREMERNMMEEMPCVSTTGDGPNGRRIEGFLYRYRKGEEVRIVCVCHGSFLTPAEFVRHAGGGDVAHPLRHIVVNPTPSAFL
ncbi:ninja-family protein AFP3 isoform X2 [Elaeis guineensis]|uniref:Ninja-family protein n=1 Tax=Elaeis guineensis var. tenera TaxID=51953 RepID=A0A6I9QBX3_ELAGV|nr:ninja-family protein AFP3 isoform X2 [Elaeis guineensis]